MKNAKSIEMRNRFRINVSVLYKFDQMRKTSFQHPPDMHPTASLANGGNFALLKPSSLTFYFWAIILEKRGRKAARKKRVAKLKFAAQMSLFTTHRWESGKSPAIAVNISMNGSRVTFSALKRRLCRECLNDSQFGSRQPDLKSEISEMLQKSNHLEARDDALHRKITLFRPLKSTPIFFLYLTSMSG